MPTGCRRQIPARMLPECRHNADRMQTECCHNADRMLRHNASSMPPECRQNAARKLPEAFEKALRNLILQPQTEQINHQNQCCALQTMGRINICIRNNGKAMNFRKLCGNMVALCHSLPLGKEKSEQRAPQPPTIN